MEHLTYSLGLDPTLRTPKALLRGWADDMDQLMEHQFDKYIDRGEAAMDQVFMLIDLDMENNCEHYTEEPTGFSNHGPVWDSAVRIADRYGLNITTYGLELATVGVHGEDELKVVLAMLKIAEETRLLILEVRPESPICLTANDVARTFNYGIPKETLLKTGWDLQNLEAVEVDLKDSEGKSNRVNLLDITLFDDFVFDLPSDKQIRNKVLEAVAEMG